MMHRVLLAGAFALGVAAAQEAGVSEYHAAGATGNAVAVATSSGPGNFFFIKTEMSLDGPTVKGAPFSADAVTETTQTLADGNRIHRTTKAALYRDSEGRTRREQTLGELGPLTAAGTPVQTIVINDPVAGVNYMLDSGSKVAHKMPAKPDMAAGAKMMAELRARTDREVVRTETRNGVVLYSAGTGKLEAEHRSTKTESLGTQTFEGVPAEGTRTTLTIPAGAIGNEQPINIVTERWYSSQLKTTVMTRTSDPRMGETVYKLQNLKLAEPDATLFTVPPDYTLN